MPATSFLRSLRLANRQRNREMVAAGNGSTFSLEFWGLELGGEVGEAQNILKKIVRERMGVPGSRATVKDLARELADVVICTDLLAKEFNIDLEDEIIEKFNSDSVSKNLKTLLFPEQL